MSTQWYDVRIVRRTPWAGDKLGRETVEELAFFENAPAWEVAPALKQLAKKIHESPPPVVLDGQEAML